MCEHVLGFHYKKLQCMMQPAVFFCVALIAGTASSPVDVSKSQLNSVPWPHRINGEVDHDRFQVAHFKNPRPFYARRAFGQNKDLESSCVLTCTIFLLFFLRCFCCLLPISQRSFNGLFLYLPFLLSCLCFGFDGPAKQICAPDPMKKIADLCNVFNHSYTE